MAHNESELGIITKAKELCKYVFTVTVKSPKQFRFSFTVRMQNLALSVIENLYRANDTPVAKGDESRYRIRYDFQCHAMTDIKILAYFSMLAMEEVCITVKLNERLKEAGFIKEDYDEALQSYVKLPTEKGLGLGLKSEKREYHGKPYMAVIYGKKAQEYLISNFEKIWNKQRLE